MFLLSFFHTHHSDSIHCPVIGLPIFYWVSSLWLCLYKFGVSSITGTGAHTRLVLIPCKEWKKSSTSISVCLSIYTYSLLLLPIKTIIRNSTHSPQCVSVLYMLSGKFVPLLLVLVWLSKREIVFLSSCLKLSNFVLSKKTSPKRNIAILPK